MTMAMATTQNITVEEARRLLGNDQALQYVKDNCEGFRMLNGAYLRATQTDGERQFFLYGTEEQIKTAFDHHGGR